MIGQVAGRPCRHRARAAAEGRHARHLRGHVARPRGPGLRASDVAGRGTRRRIRLADAARSCLHRHPMMLVPAAASAARLVRRGARPAAPRRVRREGTVPPGTAEPDKFLFERGKRRSRRRVVHGARVLPAAWSTPTRRARYRPTPSSASAMRTSATAAESRSWRSTSIREFLSFFPTQPARRLRPVQAGDGHYPQMPRPERDRPRRTRRSRSSTPFEKYPNSPLLTEARAKQREAKDRLAASNTWSGSSTYQPELVSGRGRAAAGAAEERPAVHDRDGRLLLPGRAL